MNIEELARQVGLTRHLDFRRERGQAMTLPEQQEYGRIMRFAALVRNEALEEAVQAVLKRMESNGMGDWKEAKMLRKALSGGKE